MAEDYIFTENMTVGYGKMPLIAQIEIHVKRGQIVTLIGPNGAGKSTILKSIIRQIDLLGGAVYLDRASMKDMTEKQIARRMSVLMTERIRDVYKRQTPDPSPWLFLLDVRRLC